MSDSPPDSPTSAATSSFSARVTSRLEGVSRAIAAIVVFMGCAVLAGWLLGVDLLKRGVPGFVTMEANSALAFIAAGVSLWLLAEDDVRGSKRRIGRAAASFVALVGLLTLAEYLLGRSFGIDELLFREPPRAIATSHPGRMAPTTAASFFLLGAAMLCVDGRISHRAVESLTLAAALISLLAYLGYVYGVASLYRGMGDAAMPFHAALAFLLLSAGVLFSRPDRGLMAIVSSDDAGGMMARRLLPATIAIPAALAWLRLEGQRARFYDTAFGVALFTASTIVVFTVFVLWNTRALHRIDAERRRAEQALARRAEELSRSNKELEQFAYVASHDLQEPLRMVVSYVQLLERRYAGRLDAKAGEFIRYAVDGARRMQALIGDLLAYSRVGRLGKPFHPVSCVAALDRALADLQVVMEETRATVRREPLPTVRGDDTELAQVFQNLVGNAIKFHKPDEPPEVLVTAART
ncbi:MAG: sensor histidine kinase, partial [Candidatus Binatia bacterium]